MMSVLHIDKIYGVSCTLAWIAFIRIDYSSTAGIKFGVKKRGQKKKKIQKEVQNRRIQQQNEKSAPFITERISRFVWIPSEWHLALVFLAACSHPYRCDPFPNARRGRRYTTVSWGTLQRKRDTFSTLVIFETFKRQMIFVRTWE